MSDDLGLLGRQSDEADHEQRRNHPAAAAVSPPPTRRDRRIQAQRKSRVRKRRAGTALAVVVLLVLGAAVFLGGRALVNGLGLGGSDEPVDFEGPAGDPVVIQVGEGDPTSVIAQTLTEKGVVAGPGLFTTAATGNSAITEVQPGFYSLPTGVPAAEAVSDLVNPDSRVGKVVLPEGLQLDDITGKTGSVTPGILSRIRDATCTGGGGAEPCTPIEDLQAAAADAEPTELGVPEWAVGPVGEAADKNKRLEGLIRPGTWNIDPSQPATEQLRTLITASGAEFERLGLPQTQVAGLDPYQILVASSLVQREALPGDFGKVARVIYNRLAIDQKLEFDSTVNYPLDVQAIATTPEDRDTVTPWNTYASAGLPAAPISAPSDAALQASEEPADGEWLYFVTITKDGETVFTDTFPEHQAAIEQARANGVFG